MFVLLPAFFGGRLLDPGVFCNAVVAFVCFCLSAGSIYCFNDIRDIDADRLHPRKRARPLASGQVSVRAAYITMIVSVLAALALTFVLPMDKALVLCAVLAGYWTLNIAYCLGLKRLAIVDVFIVSLGFVFRLEGGSVATGVSLSQWIIIMTFLLALFLSLAKRRDDTLMFEDSGVKMRRNIDRYTVEFLNTALSVVGSVTIVAYIMYTMSDSVIRRVGSGNLYITALFVLLGIIRYLQLAIVDRRSGSPVAVVLKDRFTQGCIVCWIVSFAMILYL